MISSFPSHLQFALRSPKVLAGIAITAGAAAGVISYALTRKKPSAEELERDRRELLAATGRIVDGSITQTQWAEDDPELVPNTLIYRYRIAGVTYECAQDVGPLLEHVRDLRIDRPIQVRFDPRNPGNSIVVAETWSGLRIDHENRVLPVAIPGDQ